MMHSCKSDENPPTDSKDIMHTRKCHMDADDDANKSGPKTICSLHLWLWEHKN